MKQKDEKNFKKPTAICKHSCQENLLPISKQKSNIKNYCMGQSSSCHFCYATYLHSPTQYSKADAVLTSRNKMTSAIIQLPAKHLVNN